VSRVLRAAIAMVAVLSAPARAQAEPEEDDDARHADMAIFEAAVALAIPTTYYWQTTEHQAIDWTIGTDWESWKTKLFTTEWLKFDTNPFNVNAVRHPLVGVIDYHILRTNGFGAPASALFAAAKGVFWEYFIEFREDPSINDMLFNAWGGLAVGEPMYRIGQLWRGGVPSLGDRARTALASPFDALHDVYRRGRWRRPAWWRSIDLEIGATVHSIDGTTRNELVAAADVDVLADPRYANGAEHDTTLGIGTSSRLRVAARLTDRIDATRPLATLLESSTSVIGKLHQDADGNSGMIGLGTAFTYRKDPLVVDKDRLAIAHLVGPQLSLARRTPRYAVRWDAALYLDVGLAQALVFRDHNPFPRPPPYYTAVQADGYIDAFGATGTTRVRASAGRWHVDAELVAHLLRQIDGLDRDPEGVVRGSATKPAATVEPALTAFGIVERRLFLRGRLGYQVGTWGIAAVADGAFRQSRWAAGGLARDVEDCSLGLVFELAY